jgi:uncharacterized protein YraI
MKTIKQLFLPLVLISALLAASACGFGNEPAPAAEPAAQIRAMQPTFTPTAVQAPPAVPVQPVATATLVAAAPAPVQATNPLTVAAAVTPTLAAAPVVTPTVAAKPKAVVNTPLINVRTGPGTEFTIVQTVDRGQEYDIVGKNASGQWWNVCCINGQSVWIINQFVDTDGPVDGVPVVTPVAGVVAPTAAPAPAAPQPAKPAAPAPAAPAPAAPAPAAPAAFEFNLIEATQFPDNHVVHAFLYVYQGASVLDGYTLRVTKNGAEIPVNALSIGGQASLTWPFQDSRQRLQNLKVEFQGVPPAGKWEFQLMRGGTPVGPVATFNLADNDPNQELYVRYEKK